MTPPTFNQALEWLTEYFKENRPEMHKGTTLRDMHSWGNGFREYWLEANDRAALEKAKKLESEGWTSKDIFLQTGWERGSEGKWRMEIPDVQYKPEGPLLNALLSKNTKTYNFFDLFDFPELEEHYPDAKNIKVTIGGKYGEAAGAYDDKTRTLYIYPWKFQEFHNGKANGRILEETRDLRGLRSVVAHELAHYVQEREGWNKAVAELGGMKGPEEGLALYMKMYDSQVPEFEIESRLPILLEIIEFLNSQKSNEICSSDS